MNKVTTAGGGGQKPDGGKPIRKGEREVWNGAVSAGSGANSAKVKCREQAEYGQ